jgi:arabinogalactan endo-1,4-beta-galactosidase
VSVASASPQFRVAVSVSPFTEKILATGTTFTDGALTAATTADLQRLFVRHGANEVYARIATTQTYGGGNGDHSMTRGLQRARLAASLGVPFNPELGLFAIYGDIRCQPDPDFTDYPAITQAPWRSLTPSQKLAALTAYGSAAARQITQTGASVRIWDIGNETELGTAGVAVKPAAGGCEAGAGGINTYHVPDEVDREIGTMSFDAIMRLPQAVRIAWLDAHVWPYEAQLLAAVARGIRSVDPHARFSTHVSGIAATQPAVALAFFKAMRDGGFAADECGVSYYPTSTSGATRRLAEFKAMAETVHRQLGCLVFIAEIAYPAGTMHGVFAWNEAVDGYPQTPDGQARFIRDLVAWGRRSGVLSGIRPWGPELAAPGWAPMSLFERHGRVVTARPALDAFASQQ